MIIDRKSRRGITLTEILIAIMILGVGLVSLATLFPIGLLRLRDASRYTRTAYLTESAAADGAARALLSPQSFQLADVLNFYVNNLNPPYWYATASFPVPNAYNPLTHDTPSYGADISVTNPLPPPAQILVGVDVSSTLGNGLPFAYDPLWRYQTINPLNPQANGPAPQPAGGYYLNDPNGSFEARFGSGIGFIRNDPSDNGLPSAHGLQRITNFNRPAVMPATAQAVTNIFVSPEDVVWQEATNNNYKSAFTTTNVNTGGTFVGVPSPVIPDLNITRDVNGNNTFQSINDWHYSWMFTGYQVSSSGGSQFEGNIVIFENRPFGIDSVPNPPSGNPLPNGTDYQVEGETVVEAVFGYSANVNPAGGPGFGAGADRTVLLRWYSTQTDPVVRVGGWIADVTYERQNAVVFSRFLSFQQYDPSSGNLIPNSFGGLQNRSNKWEWDNLPAQRCFWYQVQKVTPPINDVTVPGGFRTMVVSVDRSLNARTALDGNGQPLVLNAALISPYVVNVIPQQFSVRGPLP